MRPPFDSSCKHTLSSVGSKAASNGLDVQNQPKQRTWVVSVPQGKQVYRLLTLEPALPVFAAAAAGQLSAVHKDVAVGVLEAGGRAVIDGVLQVVAAPPASAGNFSLAKG